MKLPSNLILLVFVFSVAGATQAQQSRSNKSETRPRLVAATRVQTSKYQGPSNVSNRSAQDDDRRAESSPSFTKSFALAHQRSGTVDEGATGFNGNDAFDRIRYGCRVDAGNLEDSFDSHR